MRGLRRLWAGMMGAMALIAPEATAQVSTDKPNFVILLIDDAAFMDLGIYGGEASTPNIDTLARQGVIDRANRCKFR